MTRDNLKILLSFQKRPIKDLYVDFSLILAKLLFCGWDGLGIYVKIDLKYDIL